jgi:hypothetical protein
MDRQLLVPYILSLVLAVLYSLIAWKWIRVARLTLGAGFLFASAFNMRWALKSPNIYVQAYGARAVKDLPRVYPRHFCSTYGGFRHCHCLWAVH